MALVDGSVLGEVTGKIGNMVFRKMHGKTFVSERPLNYKQAKTPAAKKARNSFSMSVKLSKKLMSDPALKAVWTAAKIEGTDSYHRIIKHNIKLINEGSFTDRNKITPEGLFLMVDSAVIQNQVLRLRLNCPIETDLVFPAKLLILYYFRKEKNPLILTETTIPDSNAGGIYELDIQPGKSIIRLLNDNPDALLFTALISETVRKKKAYWTSTASARIL